MHRSLAHIAAIVLLAPLAAVAQSRPLELAVSVGGFLRTSYSVSLREGTLSCTVVQAAKVVGEVQGEPSEAEWAAFRDGLDTIDVWRWRSDYTDMTVLDGTQWSVSVIYADKKLVSSGSNSYPDESGNPGGSPRQTQAFERLRALVSKLVPGCRL
jgi:hypothetical protein